MYTYMCEYVNVRVRVRVKVCVYVCVLYTLKRHYNFISNIGTMAFDDVLSKYVGDCGLYQCLVIILLNIIIVSHSSDTMELVYIQATPSFWPKGDYDIRLIE